MYISVNLRNLRGGDGWGSYHPKAICLVRKTGAADSGIVATTLLHIFANNQRDSTFLEYSKKEGGRWYPPFAILNKLVKTRENTTKMMIFAKLISGFDFIHDVTTSYGWGCWYLI